MQAARSQFALKLLPSMADFAFLMPIAFLFCRMEGMKTIFSDCDTGWHIRTGEWILANHRVPTHDIFSYSKPNGAWYAWEWLSDVIWAFLRAHGGLAALGLTAILIVAFSFVLLLGLVRRHANAVVAILVTMTAAVGSSVHWLARPHLFTFFFAVVFYRALENVREGRTEWRGIPYLALLPVATILWTNLHGGFFVGIILIGTYGAGEILKAVLTADSAERRPALHRAATYICTAFACLAASLINPYTWRLHQHIVQYLFDPYLGQHIVEFFSVSFHHPLAIFFEAMLLLSALAAIQFVREGDYIRPLLLMMWAHAALLSIRNIPIFMIIAAPPAAVLLQTWLDRLPESNIAGWIRTAAAKFNRVAADLTQTDSLPRWHVVSAVGMLLVAAVVYAPHPPEDFRPEFSPKKFPVAAAEALKSTGGSRIFTSDQWGDYLIYSLYPKKRVFTDGRSDYYGADFGQKYLDVLNVNVGWEKTLARFSVDTVLMPPSSPLTGTLKESPLWKVVYDDGVAVVFRPAGKPAGKPVSVATCGGDTRGRETTKTQASDLRIANNKTKT